MSNDWPVVELGEITTDLTQSRTFDVTPDQEIVDPTISSATHTIQIGARNIGGSVRVSRRIRILPGDLVFSRLHTQNGAFGYSEHEFHSTGTFVPLALDEARVDRRFLFWALHVVVPTLSATDTVGRESYRTREILSLRLPLPALESQRRFAGRIDTLYALIAKAKALRKQDLQVTGALLAAEEKRVLGEAKEPKWPTRPLKSICSVFVDCDHHTPDYVENGVPLLRPRDIKPYQLSTVDAVKISQCDHETRCQRHRPAAGDIVYSRELSYGNAAAIPGGLEVSIGQGTVLMRTDPSQVSLAFLLRALNSPFVRDQAKSVAKGAAHPHVNLSDIRSFSIPVPTLDEQERIEAHLGQLQRELVSLERLELASYTALEGLLPSILHHAFAGNLW